MNKGYKGMCDRCGKEVIFLIRPSESLPRYCKKCYFTIALKEIEDIIKSLNDINDDNKLKDAITFLVFKMSSIEIPGIKEIRGLVEGMITRLIRDKDKRDKIFILLAIEEKR